MNSDNKVTAQGTPGILLTNTEELQEPKTYNYIVDIECNPPDIVEYR